MALICIKTKRQKPTDPQMCVQYGTFPLCVGVDLTRSLLSVQTWSPSPFLQGETPRSHFRAVFELPWPNYTVKHNVAVIMDLKNGHPSTGRKLHWDSDTTCLRWLAFLRVCLYVYVKVQGGPITFITKNSGATYIKYVYMQVDQERDSKRGQVMRNIKLH